MEVKCNLPDDLVQCILSRLPVKCLLRFRSVCKDWRALIDSPAFITHHYQLQYSISKLDGNIPHFGFFDLNFLWTEKFYLLSIHQGHVSTVDMNANLERDCFKMLPLGRDECSISCCGCVNGVILLEFNWYTDHSCLGLWNPSTRDFKSVTYPFARSVAGSKVDGFGFDRISNDFKILATHKVYCGDMHYHHIYSLRTNTWKRLNMPPGHELPYYTTDGYLSGVHYWYGYPEYANQKDMIVSFNFSSEIYSVSDVPEDAQSLITGAFQYMIALYKESVGLFVSYEVREKPLLYNVDIWVVTEFNQCGVPLSWQHLLTLGPTLTKLRLMVATARVDGDLLLTYIYMSDHDIYNAYTCGKEYLYNPSTAEFKYLDDRIAQYYRYTESLFPISNQLIEL